MQYRLERNKFVLIKTNSANVIPSLFRLFSLNVVLINVVRCHILRCVCVWRDREREGVGGEGRGERERADKVLHCFETSIASVTHLGRMGLVVFVSY